jgi:Ca2+-binding EF-hand superfamily protein
MADFDLNQLEEIILHKVQQRTPPRMNEDTYVVKVFRFNDLGNSGFCEFDQFKKALLPFSSGVSEQDLMAIFQRYAPEGALNYKNFAVEFVSGVRRVPGLALESPEDAWETIDDTINRIKDFLYSQGPRGLIALVCNFRDADPQNQRILAYDEFFGVMLQFFNGSECPVSEDQLDMIFQNFRHSFAPGQIAYDEFFLALKEELSPERRASIRAAFRRLDTNSEGLVDIMNMIDSFNANRHPQVSDGSLEANEVLEEFAETLKDLVLFRRGARSYPTNLVAWEEFEDYYKFISGCYETDGLFCSILQKVWDLDKAPDMAIEARASMAAPAAGLPPKSRAGLHHWQTNTLPTNPNFRNTGAGAVPSVDTVLANARRLIGKKGIRAAINVVRNFYAADDDNDDFLDVYEFRRACQQSGLSFPAGEEARIFEACGQGPYPGVQGSSVISVPKFLNSLHGDIAPSRLAIVEKVWTCLGGDLSDEKSAVSPAMLKDRVACDQHPQVMRGELDPGAFMAEFLDTFSLLAFVRGGCENGMVSFADLLAYYEVVSSTISNDAFFNLLLNRLWMLPSEAWGEESQDQMPDSPGREQTSPRGRMPVKNPMAEPRPPTQSGPSVYNTMQPDQRNKVVGESHRRFLRKEPQVPLDAGQRQAPNPTSQFSPITKSSIVFDEEGTSELSVVCSRLRASLARRGLKGWRALIERFESYDNRRNGAIMRLDWERVHKTLGLGLSPEERDILFRTLSLNRKDGAMDYAACLRQLKNTLPPRRQALVATLYDELKVEDQELVSAQEIKSRFDARNSPMCMLGKQDAQAATREFYEAVDFFSLDGAFDPQGFADFFAMVSGVHEEDYEFGLMTGAAFGLA